MSRSVLTWQVERVALNRMFELHGPELALCWAFRRHVEMALTTLCIAIVVYKGFVRWFENTQEEFLFWDETVVGFVTCAVWAPYTLNQWKWVEANLLMLLLLLLLVLTLMLMLMSRWVEANLLMEWDVSCPSLCSSVHSPVCLLAGAGAPNVQYRAMQVSESLLTNADNPDFRRKVRTATQPAPAVLSSAWAAALNVRRRSAHIRAMQDMMEVVCKQVGVTAWIPAIGGPKPAAAAASL